MCGGGGASVALREDAMAREHWEMVASMFLPIFEVYSMAAHQHLPLLAFCTCVCVLHICAKSSDAPPFPCRRLPLLLPPADTVCQAYWAAAIIAHATFVVQGQDTVAGAAGVHVAYFTC